MKIKILTIAFLVAFLGACSPIYRKVAIPYNTQTNKMEWSTNINFGGMKNEDIYVKIIQWANLKYINKNIKTQDKENGIISIADNGEYLFKGHTRQMSYLVIFLIKDGNCKVSITNVTIRHRPAEFYYDEYIMRNFESHKLENCFFSVDNYFNFKMEEIKNGFEGKEQKRNIISNYESDMSLKKYAYQDSVRTYRMEVKETLRFKNIYGRNIIGFNLVPLLNKDFNISYEHFFAKQKFSIKLPFYLGYSSKGLLNNDSTAFQYFYAYNFYKGQLNDTFHLNSFERYHSTILSGNSVGLHLKYYPTGEGKLRGFAAIGFEYSILNILTTHSYNVTSYYQNPIIKTDNKTDRLYSFGGTAYGGIVYQPNKLISLSMDFGVQHGLSNFEYVKTLYRLGIGVGMRF